MLFLTTADIDKASCLAKFSKLDYVLLPYIALNSSVRDLFLVISLILFMNMQK